MLASETSDLKQAWAKHPSEFLDSYLIQDVEDPRINIQSILTRHFLIRQLFAEYDCDYLAKHEIRFSLTANWLLDLLKSPLSHHEINDRTKAVFDALLSGNADSELVEVPSFLLDTFEQLSFPNYISDLLTWTPHEQDGDKIPDYLLNAFADIWAQTLGAEQTQPISVIEPACGSANDFRFLCAFGLSKFLQYTGFDLSEKNISNAKATHPSVDFRVGNVFDIPVDDKSFEFCFVHDFLEHLSAEGIERAIQEMCRVTSKKICLHFFNMDESNQHQIIKCSDYHWNRLSRELIYQLFRSNAKKIESVHIDTFLKEQFSYPDTHNKQAWTWLIDLVQ